MVIKRAQVIEPTWKEFKNFKKFMIGLIAAGEPKKGITVVSNFLSLCFTIEFSTLPSNCLLHHRILNFTIKLFASQSNFLSH